MPRTSRSAREVAPGLAMFTIYDRPADYPDSFVVRRFRIVAGGREPVPDPEAWAICPTLDAAREALPGEACVRLARHPTDAGCIVETWT